MTVSMAPNKLTKLQNISDAGRSQSIKRFRDLAA